MANILISTIWNQLDSTKLSIREFNIQKIIFLIDNISKETQLKNIKHLKEMFKNMIDITEIKVEEYDLVSIAQKSLNLIDSIPENEKIYADISQGKKPQALGLLFACYAKSNKIEKIVYWGEDKQMNVLPKISFNTTKDKKIILNEIKKTNNIKSLLPSPNMSKSKLYRLIQSLENDGLILKKEKKYILTDAGKVAML